MNLAILNGFGEVVKVFMEYINIEEYNNTKPPFTKENICCTKTRTTNISYSMPFTYPKSCEMGCFIHQAVISGHMNVLKIIFDDCMKKKKDEVVGNYPHFLGQFKDGRMQHLAYCCQEWKN